MYQKPTLQRFGTFRDLTRLGSDTDGDGGILGTGIGDGCNVYAGGDCGS
jgi:hypothetical protein